MSVIAGVGCCISLLYAPGIDPALSAWELDCHGSLTIALQVRPQCRSPSFTWTTATPPVRSGLPNPDAIVVSFGGQPCGAVAQS